MKHITFFLLVATLVLLGCKDKTSQETTIHNYARTSNIVTTNMVDIDEISECEKIIADSTLMGADGERGWKNKGDDTISIKNGDKYYLRIMTKDGNITDFTYNYSTNKQY